MALKYSSKHDISYVNYNNKNIPWQLNTTIISQNNQTINPSLNIGSINNNLLIESSQNNIVLITPQNKKVVVKTSMIVNGNFDASNNLTTNRVVAKDISLNNKLYMASIPINIIGDIKVQGSISIVNSTSTGLKESESEFINVTLTTSKFTDVSIVNCTISSNPYFFYDLNIINSYIYNIPIGYDEYNNVFPNKASFSDVSLQCLVLNSSINTGCYIKFSNTNSSNTNSSNTNSSNTNSSNTNSSNIIIKSFDDYSKLEISKPLNIGLGFGESNTNISNISIFNGDISCYTLYYSQLVPDIRLNNYFDVSIGLVSVSGNNIPNSNMRFNIGSTNYKFNEIISTQFIGDLNGTASSANDLKKNLDMSFNTLDIYGTITLNKKNLSQFVSGDLISIVAADVSFIAANNRVRDLSRVVYLQTNFDLCLNTNFAKRNLLEASFINLNNNITSISNNVYSKSVLDLCLNRNYIRNNDVSAIASIVSNPPLIYPGLFYLNSSLNKVTDAKVANELVFPYAITYVDDAYEDNFLKEDYSYQISVFINTTTTYVRPANAQPDDLNAKRAVIRYVNSTDPTYKNTWNDVGENELLPAVYKINVPGVFTRSFHVNTTLETWDWHYNNARNVTGRSLADILNSTENEQIRAMISRDTWTAGKRKVNVFSRDRTSATWEWITGSQWSYTNWEGDEPGGLENRVKIQPSGGWHDYDNFLPSVYITTGPAVYVTVTNIPASSYYEVNSALMTWQQHKQEAINRGGQIAIIQDDVVNNYIGSLIAASNIAFTYKDARGVYINLRRTTNGTDPYGVTVADWQWDSGEPWYGYHKFYQGGVLIPEYTNNYRTDSYISSNPKLPIIVASSNGSVVATCTAIPSVRPNDAINNSALNIGSFKISENNNNNSYYSLTYSDYTTISTSFSCIAISDDGRFFAFSKANIVTVYMKNSSAWQTLGSSIGVDFAPYTNTDCNILWNGYESTMYCNLKNLAINYISGENPPRIFLAFGDSRNSIKVYSYDNANWIFSNGFYSVTGGSWVLKHTHLASTLGASTNFGYFVVLSHNPRILVFSIDDRFYSYNCSDSSFSARGSNTFIRLPTGVTNFTNIIALKITSDADKIIVSNTHYVYIYKWNNASSSWTQVTVLNVVPLPQQLQPFTVLQGTGGTVTTNGGYIIHRFTNVGTSTFVPASSGSVEVLIVGGGGGGGGRLGGGGGGGGVIYMPSVSVVAGTNYSIVVGNGGAALNNGQNSTAFGATAAGGGTSGVHDDGVGTTGGSGGGAASNNSNLNQGQSTSGNSLGSNKGLIYGNRGGHMTAIRTGDPTRAAGGGGAGGNGIDTNPNITGNTGQTGAGAGGVGVINAILGPRHYWGGGGGGGGYVEQFGGWGGLGGGGGGGGNGGVGTGGGSAFNSGAAGSGLNGGNGGANTGGGGGGCGWVSEQGGTGGSGIVVIRYLQTSNLAGPRSLDISNINSNNNDCVFAIGFPDKLINSRANNNSRGYVEYYQCLTSSPSAIITKLATLVPRKRDINNNNVDTNEYFFSAGGIKITNANTILVSPNFKFHFNNTTKNYEYNSSTQSWTAHNTNATSVTGRTMASIENEVENELVKITGRGSNFYIGGIGAATQTGYRRGSLNWRWSNNDIFNYENWESTDRPYSVVNQWIEFYGPQGTWNNTSVNRQAMYMTRSLSYSLNNFNVFDRFYFHSSGFFSSYFPTDVSNRVIARWATTDTPLNRSIEIRANGQMFSRSYGSISDIRLKENIVDVTPKLVDLLKVRVVNYNLKGCKDAKFIGVVAQELEQIFPALVKDGDLSPQDINLHKTETYKSVKYSCFDVMLIKAFQEQMAIINTLSSQLDEQEKKCKLLKIISQDTIILNNDLDFLKRENELLKLNINEILKLMTKC